MEENQRVTLDISTATIIRIIVLVALALFLYLIHQVVAVVFFAIVIASALDPIARKLEEKKIPRMLSVIVLYILVFSFIIFILSLIVPVLLEEVNQLNEVLPNIVNDIASILERAQESESPAYSELVVQIQAILSNISNFLKVSDQSIFGFFSGIFGGALSFVAVVVISFYFSLMPKGILEFIQSILPDRYEEYVIRLWKKSERKVGRWLRGQLILALAIGLSTYIGLSLLNIKYALVLALIAMVLELIPIAGPIMASIPAIALASIQSWQSALAVLILYVIIQQLEANFLTPFVLGKTVGLHPVTVIIAIFIGGVTLKIMG